MLERALQGFAWQLDRGVLEVQTAGVDGAGSIAEASSAALRCLLEAGADVIEVRRGRGLESVYMRERASWREVMMGS